MNRENAWTTYEEADIKALEGLCKEYKDFLSNGKTERECVAQSIELAKKAGYQDLEELTLVKAIILVAVILIIYVIVLVAYWIASGRFYQKKHSEARARVKKYSHNLLVLNKLYEKENM